MSAVGVPPSPKGAGKAPKTAKTTPGRGQSVQQSLQEEMPSTTTTTIPATPGTPALGSSNPPREQLEQQQDPPQVVKLRKLLDSNSGQVTSKWAKDMFDGDNCAMAMLESFIQQNANTTTTIDDIFGIDGLLKTKYAKETYYADARIYQLRHRHHDDFQKVCNFNT